MPLSVATLQAEKREFDLPYAGENVHITYRPGLITPEGDALPYGEWIAKVIVAWDLEGSDGEAYPLDVDDVRKLPDSFLLAVTKGVLTNARLDPTTSATSADG